MKFRDAYFVEALYVVFVAFCLVALSSCAYHSQIEKKIDQEAKAQPALPPGPALSRASEAIIAEAPNLTPKQRQALEDLRARSAQEQKSIREQIGQHQLVLVKNLVDPKVSDSEIKVVRQKILGLEKERTNLWLNSLDEAKNILGRRSDGDERVYRAFLMEEPLATPHGKIE
ncbi:MAG: hypothetical protein ACXWQO_18305 [Bdellovibrionota bacterium]